LPDLDDGVSLRSPKIYNHRVRYQPIARETMKQFPITQDASTTRNAAVDALRTYFAESLS